MIVLDKTFQDVFIESLPANWMLSRIKDVGKIYGRIGYRGYTTSDIVEEGKGALSISPGNISNNLFTLKSKTFISWDKYYESPEIMIFPKDIILVKTGSTIGKVALIPDAEYKLTLNPQVIVLKKIKIDNSFFYYFLTTDYIKYLFECFQSGGATPAISQEKINNFVVGFPNDFSEQNIIAQYLDTKTQAIDKKVKLLEQKIRHYKELRKSIINKAVTKGLDGSTKNWKNVRLKDIGYLYSGLSGKSADDFNQDENPNSKRFIPFTNIANNTYIDKTNFGTVVMSENEKQNCVKSGDLFFLMSSEGYEDIGKTAVLGNDIGEVYLNSFCKGYRINNNKYFAPFINYLLLSDTYRKKMIVEGKGFTRINLKMEKVNDFEIFIPSFKSEQTEIAQYLDEKTSTIDRIVKNIETQITTLKELRKTLVNYVVMGKIKVVEA
jgi:type I restriction enzyme S subunit